MIATAETTVDWTITNPEPHILALTLTPHEDITIEKNDYLKLHFLGMQKLFRNIRLEVAEGKPGDWNIDFRQGRSHVVLRVNGDALTLQKGVPYEGVKLNYRFNMDRNVSHRVLFHLQFFGIQVRNDVESHELDLLVFDKLPQHELELEILGPNKVFTDGRPDDVVVRLINRGPRTLVIERSQAELFDEENGRYALAELRLLHDGDKDPTTHSYPVIKVNPEQVKPYPVRTATNGENGTPHSYAFDDALTTTDVLNHVDLFPSQPTAQDSAQPAWFFSKAEIDSQTFWRMELNRHVESIEIQSGKYFEFHIRNIHSELLEGNTLVQLKMLTLDVDLYEYTFITPLERTPLKISGNAENAKMEYGDKLTITSSWGEVNKKLQVVLDKEKLSIIGNTEHELLSVDQQGAGHSAQFIGGVGVTIERVKDWANGLHINVNTTNTALYAIQNGVGNSAHFEGGKGVIIDKIVGANKGLEIDGETIENVSLLFVNQTGKGNTAHFHGGKGVKIDGVDVHHQHHALEVRGKTEGQSLIYAEQDGPDHVAHFVGGAGVYINAPKEGNSALSVKGETKQSVPLFKAVQLKTGYSGYFQGGRGVNIGGISGNNYALSVQGSTRWPLIMAQQDNADGFAASFRGGKGVEIKGELHLTGNINSPDIIKLQRRVAENESELDQLTGKYHLLQAGVQAAEEAIDVLFSVVEGLKKATSWIPGL